MIATEAAYNNAGGTNTGAGAKGAVEGANFYSFLQSPATNFLLVNGVEFDVGIATGASAQARIGVSVVSYLPVAGATTDVAYQVGTTTGSAPWVNAFQLSNAAGIAPIATTGCVICTDGSADTIATGIDLSAYTISGVFLKGPAGFQVNGGGSLVAQYITSLNYILSSSPTAGIGYATGAGGTVTQSSTKATGVTLNTATGKITMNAAALAAATIVSFTLTDSAIAATDVLVLNHISGGTVGSYTLNAQAAAGSATINVRNATAGSLSEAIVIEFTVIKGVTS